MVIMSLMILIIAIALTPYKGGISPILFTRLTSIIFLFSGALAYNALYIQSIGSGLSLYSGLFQVTVLSQSFDLLIYILASLILIPWSNNFKYVPTDPTALKGWEGLKESYLNTDKSIILSYISGPIVKEYSLIVLFSTLGSSLLLSSGNLLSMYLSIELQSFGVYILASIYRDSESATNAGLKYFLLGGLSSCLILLGCVLIYSYTGVINFEDIYSLLVSSNNDISTILQLGLILIFIGFFFKIAAAPFHNWAPDVYNDVPSIVTT
jgi:NADH-ubiquinone oxidoreductase chain 2